MVRAWPWRRLCSTGAVCAFLLQALVGVARAEDDPFAALPAASDPGWDAAAADALVRASRSRPPLSASAVEAISCEAWLALDQDVRGVWGAGLPTIYGFFEGLVWVGDALGIAEAARAPALDRLLRCGLSAEVVGHLAIPRSDLARQLRALPDAGSDPWFEVVAGLLDAPLTEKDALTLSCDVWAALDASLLAQTGRGVAVALGVSRGYPWRGDRLGLSLQGRSAVLRHLVRCGLAHTPTAPAATSDLVTVLSGLPGPGRSRWDAKVRGLMLASFDADDSGEIDTVDEVRAVPCEVWQTLDAAIRGPNTEGLAARYGIDGQRSWYGYALGLDVGVRRVAADAIGGCVPEDRGTAELLERLGGLADGGTRSWDASVRRVLLQAFDADRSGALGEADIAGVPCEVWDVIDAKARMVHPHGLIHGYGLKRADPRAERLGFARDALRVAYERARECLRGTPDEAIEGRLRAIKDAPGDDGWGIAVRVALLRTGDLDGSGWIERREEVEAVPCVAWRALDEAVREQAGAGILDVYGLRGRRRWGGNELGLGRAVWRPARRAVLRCLHDAQTEP